MIELPLSIPSIDIQIPHRNWNNALSEAFAILIAAEPGDVVCITGPSRVGKTRLSHELCRLLSGGIPYEESGNMITVAVEAANTGPNGIFSTKSFMQRMLEAIQHPIYSTANINIGDIDLDQNLMNVSEGKMRLALERGLVKRNTKYLIIDEAQHARYASKGARGGYAVMDSWKCLAQMANIILVVVGAYPILDILRGSPHLVGRKHQVHLPRYHETVEDLEEFCLILAHYDQVVELGVDIQTLQECIEPLYEGTLGCIGLLRGWLTRASAIGVLRNEGITKDILMETVASGSDLKTIYQEIEHGEKLINEVDIGLLPNTSVKKKSTGKGKPFKRKPKRLKKNNRTEKRDDDE